MSIISELEKIIDDLASVESAVIKKTKDGQKVIAYSKLELEGDSITWISDVDKDDQALVGLQSEILINSYKGKLAMVKMASSIIDIIKIV